MEDARFDVRVVNVLIVDHHAENRLALRAMLEQPDYKIVEADDGDAAMHELSQHDFAVVLLDVDTDASQFDKLVRHDTRKVPVLFVTERALDSDFILRGYRAGAADHLAKPLVPELVRAKVAVFAQLCRQRMQIESSLHEKEILLREIHHRVKNNLQIISSLLNLQASRQSAEVRQLFVETNARVRSIALVHEQLHRADNFAAIDINGYLRALAMGLLQTYGTLRVDVSARATATAVTIDVAIPCGLIVNELVSNALKYAFPKERTGTIVVSLSEERGMLALEVSDDGIGIPETVDIETAPTMGLQLVRSLAHQLGGTIELQRQSGTRVRISFPRPRPSG
jgi:two-component sensor histidine kinase